MIEHRLLFAIAVGRRTIVPVLQLFSVMKCLILVCCIGTCRICTKESSVFVKTGVVSPKVHQMAPRPYHSACNLVFFVQSDYSSSVVCTLQSLSVEERLRLRIFAACLVAHEESGHSIHRFLSGMI